MTVQSTYNGASPASIQHHYDVSNQFYEIWLDPTLTYSCALWESGDLALEAAQGRKLDYLIQATRLPSAPRVLDIGCGWGSLLRRLVEQHGAREVVGLTLSKAQALAISRWATNRYSVRVENWIDHVPNGLYDGIISIGAFEHFAKYGMTRSARIAAYREFFVACHGWLPAGGRLALQTVCKGGNKRMSRETVRDLLFVIQHIFPESELPRFPEILEACQGSFELVSARNDPDHYGRTCQAWHDSLLARRATAEQHVSSAVVDDYLRYLSSSVHAFERRHLGLLRLSFERL